MSWLGLAELPRFINIHKIKKKTKSQWFWVECSVKLKYEYIYWKYVSQNYNWTTLHTPWSVSKTPLRKIWFLRTLSTISTQEEDLIILQELKDKGCDCNHIIYVTQRHNIRNLHNSFKKMTPLIGPRPPLLLKKLDMGLRAVQSLITTSSNIIFSNSNPLERNHLKNLVKIFQ